MRVFMSTSFACRYPRCLLVLGALLGSRSTSNGGRKYCVVFCVDLTHDALPIQSKYEILVFLENVCMMVVYFAVVLIHPLPDVRDKSGCPLFCRFVLANFVMCALWHPPHLLLHRFLLESRRFYSLYALVDPSKLPLSSASLPLRKPYDIRCRFWELSVVVLKPPVLVLSKFYLYKLRY